MSKTVLITGANRGIGLELAKLHSQAGWAVFATFRDANTSRELIELIGKNAIQHDVKDEDANKALPGKLGIKIDRLINNAGTMTTRTNFEEISTSHWLETFHVNTVAPAQIAVAAAPYMSKGSQLISISSRIGSIAQVRDGKGADIPIYRASKAALNMVMACFEKEAAEKNISTYVMHPGWVRTDMGGTDADLSVAQSAGNLFATMNNLEPSQSGGFFNHDGQEIAY